MRRTPSPLDQVRPRSAHLRGGGDVGRTLPTGSRLRRASLNCRRASETNAAVAPPRQTRRFQNLPVVARRSAPSIPPGDAHGRQAVLLPRGGDKTARCLAPRLRHRLRMVRATVRLTTETQPLVTARRNRGHGKTQAIGQKIRHEARIRPIKSRGEVWTPSGFTGPRGSLVFSAAPRWLTALGAGRNSRLPRQMVPVAVKQYALERTTGQPTLRRRKRSHISIEQPARIRTRRSGLDRTSLLDLQIVAAAA